MFDTLSLSHILMVLVIVLLFFGAKRIPEIAGSMGKGIREEQRRAEAAPLMRPLNITDSSHCAAYR